MEKNNYITRVEGHGDLKIDFNKNKAQIIVEEEERLFEQLVLNYPYTRAPFITARICGICPTAHYLASIKALEAAFDLKPTKSAKKLREVLLAGQIVQSHALHLFFLVLPDYLNTDSVKELGQQHPAEFHLGLNLKNVADKIVKLIGGREVHPLAPKVGGFKKAPSLSKLKGLLTDIDEVLDEATDTATLLSRFEYPTLNQEKREYLTIKSSGYPYYRGDKVQTKDSGSFKAANYQTKIIEAERAGTLVKFSQLNKKGATTGKVSFMLGALARLNLKYDKLNPLASKALKRSSLNPPSFNPFNNILSQAVEIIHFLEEAKRILEDLTGEDLKNLDKKINVKSGKGVGVVEAPRGTLYHYYELDKNGIIKEADIVTPTAQNMLSLEADASKLINERADLSQAKKEQLVEHLIRAYDPCLTCSVH